MPHRRLKISGLSVRTRTAYLPCGRKYSGKIRTVNKLVELHRKKCSICSESDTNRYAQYNYDAMLNQEKAREDFNNSLIKDRQKGQQ